jgi:hypothetical protein
LQESLQTVHVTEVWQRFYDYDLNENVGYAKHAIAIDENQKDFARVPWARKDAKSGTRDAGGNLWFEQVWFAGNHSDIGGSYSESESRLSDTALQWMTYCARAVEHGLQVLPYCTFIHPQMEFSTMRWGEGSVSLRLSLGLSWTEQHRRLPARDAIIHRSSPIAFDRDIGVRLI